MAFDDDDQNPDVFKYVFSGDDGQNPCVNTCLKMMIKTLMCSHVFEDDDQKPSVFICVEDD